MLKKNFFYKKLVYGPHYLTFWVNIIHWKIILNVEQQKVTFILWDLFKQVKLFFLYYVMTAPRMTKHCGGVNAEEDKNIHNTDGTWNNKICRKIDLKKLFLRYFNFSSRKKNVNGHSLKLFSFTTLNKRKTDRIFYLNWSKSYSKNCKKLKKSYF
jgi:hypothetical protein